MVCQGPTFIMTSPQTRWVWWFLGLKATPLEGGAKAQGRRVVQGGLNFHTPGMYVSHSERRESNVIKL